MARQTESMGKNWYVIHTNAGYEEKVTDEIKQRVEAYDMQDKIFNIMVPKEKRIEIRNGKRRTIERRFLPGYVLVEMIVTDDSWYVVRNTPNVTGFIGSGTTPIPVSDSEMKNILRRTGIDEPKFKIDVEPGDTITIIDGPFKDFDGTVSEIDEGKGKLKVLVSMFGRETPVELDFLQIKKL